MLWLVAIWSSSRCLPPRASSLRMLRSRSLAGKRGEPHEARGAILAHLDGEISAIRRSSDRLESAGTNVDAARARGRQLKRSRDDLARALQDRGVPLLKQIPNFEQMLSSTAAGDHLYSIYIEASQYTHRGHAATWLYRMGGVGTHKVVRETITAEQWILPLRMCWLALCHPGDIVATRIARSASAAWSRRVRGLGRRRVP